MASRIEELAVDDDQLEVVQQDDDEEEWEEEEEQSDSEAPKQSLQSHSSHNRVQASRDQDDEDFQVEPESIGERIIALQEMFPPIIRTPLVGTISWTWWSVRSALYYSGKAAWIFAVTALIVAAPLDLKVEEERMIKELEQLQQQQLQHQRQLLQPNLYNPPSPSSQFPISMPIQ